MKKDRHGEKSSHGKLCARRTYMEEKKKAGARVKKRRHLLRCAHLVKRKESVGSAEEIIIT